MAMKSLVCNNLVQAYSVVDWEYTDWNAAYAGYAGEAYLCTILRFDVPEFSGVPDVLNVSLISFSGIGKTVSLRWALCTSDSNRGLYTDTKDDVEDSNQIEKGVVVIPDVTSETRARSFRVTAKKLKGGRTYYLFLWNYNDTGFELRGVTTGWGSHSVILEYTQGIIRVKIGGVQKPHMVFIKTGGKAVPAIPYVKTGTGIKPGG